MKPRTAASPAMRIVAGALLLLGVLLLLASIFAEPLNIGRGIGFGWKQLIGVVIGLVLALLGAAWLVQPPTSRGIDRPLE